ncbi:thiamine phosphate synthase [Nibricoccus aquaticus]|nr:thiamine phosphate synthase [Nibricoccus aquaticus]
MPLEHRQLHPLMCLTQDGLAETHLEQATRLLIAGARWIQVRMKRGTPQERLTMAGMIAPLCRQYGAICIVNDSVDIAIAVNAHGVHLGKTDGLWSAARKEMGREMIIGGTINNEADARRAIRANCLDYVGIGPWRFTTTKENLSPVLGPTGVATLVAQLDGIPVWAIGGITAADLPEVRASGAVGAAVTSALYRDGRVQDNFHELNAAWKQAMKT